MLRCRFPVPSKSAARGLGKLARGTDDFADQRRQIHGRGIELELTGFDLREVEHLVDVQLVAHAGDEAGQSARWPVAFPRRKAYQPKWLQSPLDETSVACQLDSDKSASGKMMASDDKKVETDPARKNEAPPKSEGTSGADLSKAEGGEKSADLPSGYSRGERQKPVSKAYKDNWNVIFAKKKKR